jgi:hypothetical protein
VEGDDDEGEEQDDYIDRWKQQIPKLSKIIDAKLIDLSKFHVGTINVILDQPLIITQFDLSTLPVQWHPDPRVDTDRFSFLRIRFELETSTFGTPVDAIIYHAAASPHHFAAAPYRSNPRFIEVMTEKRLTFHHPSRCLIHIERA